MRGLTSTVVLLVALLGLGAYIYFVESGTPPEGTDAERVFGTLTADDIDEIQVAVQGGDTTTLRKRNGTWHVAQPLEADADEGAVAAMAGSLAALTVERTLDGASDAKAFGLDPAHIEVRFHTKGGASHRVLLGAKTPAGSSVYARRGTTPDVFLVSAAADSTFDKTTFALRNKQALHFDRGAVNRLELESGSFDVVFARTGSDWRIEQPIKARGDYGTIENLVERLGALQVQGIVADNATDLAKYGLAAPTALATVVAGSARATLALGRTEGGLTYARDVSRPLVFTVPSTVQADLIKDLVDYRRKDLFDARSFTATRVEFRRGDQVQVIEKSQAADKTDVWKDASGKVLDTVAVEELLSKLTSLRAESFTTPTARAFDTPALAVTVAFSDKRTETVTFAREGAEVLARRPDEPGAATLTAASFNDVIAALDALK